MNHQNYELNMLMTTVSNNAKHLNILWNLKIDYTKKASITTRIEILTRITSLSRSFLFDAVLNMFPFSGFIWRITKNFRFHDRILFSWVTGGDFVRNPCLWTVPISCMQRSMVCWFVFLLGFYVENNATVWTKYIIGQKHPTLSNFELE